MVHDPDELIGLTRFRRLFLRGLSTLLPTLLTLIIIVKLLGFMNEYFGQYIGRWLVTAAAQVNQDLGTPDKIEINGYLRRENLQPDDENIQHAKEVLRKQNIDSISRRWYIVVTGFVVAILIIYTVGIFVASFIGRAVWHLMEASLIRIPVVKQIYPLVKQVTDYAFGEQKLSFSRVVAVQYPRMGIWSVGFVTSNGMSKVRKAAGTDDILTIFIPSSPTPMTGYTIQVQRSETVDLPINIDEAFRFLISGGVISPGLLGDEVPAVLEKNDEQSSQHDIAGNTDNAGQEQQSSQS